MHIDDLVLWAGNGSVPSVLSMFYPGQEAGDALMAVLLGKRSPAAKLPYTWYSRGFAQSRGVIYDNDLRSGQGITYRYWTGPPPLLEYGHGLSYTNFSYSWASAPAQSIAALPRKPWRSAAAHARERQVCAQHWCPACPRSPPPCSCLSSCRGAGGSQ